MSNKDLQDKTQEQTVEDEKVQRPQVDSLTYRWVPVKLLAEVQDTFEMFCDARGQQMNIRNLNKALRSMGVDATKNDLLAIVETYDPDGRGYIDLDQWTAAIIRRLAEDVDRRDRFRAQLAAGDKDGTGKVTVAHARNVIQTFDPTATTDIDRADMLDSANDGQGLIDYKYFMSTMVRPARFELPL